MKPMTTNVPMKANKVFIALGTNIGEKEKNLQIALTEISEFAEIIKKSEIHETKPEGFKEQDDFLNMVVEVSTTLTPTELIIRLQEIEHKMGRVRTIKNGPRIIDLDILLYEDQIISAAEIKIPHPRMHKRSFVLNPLSEIAPQKIHPILKISIENLANNL